MSDHDFLATHPDHTCSDCRHDENVLRPDHTCRECRELENALRPVPRVIRLP